MTGRDTATSALEWPEAELADKLDEDHEIALADRNRSAVRMRDGLCTSRPKGLYRQS